MAADKQELEKLREEVRTLGDQVRPMGEQLGRLQAFREKIEPYMADLDRARWWLGKIGFGIVGIVGAYAVAGLIIWWAATLNGDVKQHSKDIGKLQEGKEVARLDKSVTALSNNATTESITVNSRLARLEETVRFLEKHYGTSFAAATVMKVADGKLTLKTADGKTKEYRVGPDTTITLGGRKVKAAELKPGMKVYFAPRGERPDKLEWIEGEPAGARQLPFKPG
ncbi:MAG TPA: hypothetical protein VG013_42945 [Gemmataceae bacterium]|jgi:hypothetical protein|nr:hypothetical protein [Gemmataceae bacterium]